MNIDVSIPLEIKKNNEVILKKQSDRLKVEGLEVDDRGLEMQNISPHIVRGSTKNVSRNSTLWFYYILSLNIITYFNIHLIRAASGSCFLIIMFGILFSPLSLCRSFSFNVIFILMFKFLKKSRAQQTNK